MSITISRDHRALRLVPVVVLASLALTSCRSSRPAGRPAPAGAPVATIPDPVPTQRLVPAPTSLTVAGGAPFTLRDSAVISVGSDSPAMMRVAELLAGVLRPSTGFPIPVVMGNEPPAGSILLRLASTGMGSIDAYQLTVRPERVEITASDPAGVFRGAQTLRQLFPANIESHMRLTEPSARWVVPSLTISDAPRFAWRGAMLDVSRHFFTVDEVKQYIDILALYKMNVLHLHLSDDQGWRIEIKSRPQLTAMGGVTEVGGGPGGFYTQEQYTDIVRYAQDRFITIVPEIDLPGHTNAALVAFPDLSCGKRPPALYTGTEVGFSSFCVEKEGSYALIDDIVREISSLTPGPYFHMGGDEVEALTHEQYAHFVERVQGIVRKHGKQMIGWEEIRKAKLDPSTIVQQWIGDTISLQHGGKMVMSPSKRLYIDMKYDASTELGLRWAALIDVRTTYDWDPATYNPSVPESMILGVESPMWTETLRNITAVQFMALPRIPSVAEVGWTAQSARNWESFRTRIAAHGPRWNYLGVNYHRAPEIPW
jgi:hexosaminidase